MRSSPHMFRLATITVIAAAGIAFSAPSSAQTAGRALVSDNTLYTLPTQNPGCGGANGTGPNVSAALQNAGNYTYTNSYTAAYNMIQAPGSYFACLTSLLTAAQGLLNMFNNMGSLNLSSVLTAIAQAAVATLIQTLANQVCQAVNTMKGSSGIIIPAVSSLLAGVGAAAAAGSAATPAQVSGTVNGSVVTGTEATSSNPSLGPFDSPTGTITSPNTSPYGNSGYDGGDQTTTATTPTYVDPSTVVLGTGTVQGSTGTVVQTPNYTALVNSPAPTLGAPTNPSDMTVTPTSSTTGANSSEMSSPTATDNNGTTTVNTQTPASSSTGSAGIPPITTNDSDTNSISGNGMGEINGNVIPGL